jgi:glycosyltransferase involved in cell wall biosynthesis
LPARLGRAQGQIDVIDALARLGRRDVSCLMVGSDQGRTGYRRDLDRRIAHHDLGGVVHLVDHCPDPAAAYGLATVVISASREPEAFGRAVAEAQAMGRPVIATDVGAVREIVLPGQTGQLVPPHDPAALARALATALAMTADQRTTLAQRAQAHIAAHFSKDRMCQQTLSVYRDLADSPRRLDRQTDRQA